MTSEIAPPRRRSSLRVLLILLAVLVVGVSTPRPAHALAQLGLGAGYSRSLVPEQGNSIDVRASFDVYLVAVGFGVESRLRPAAFSTGSKSWWMNYGNFRLVSPGPYLTISATGYDNRTPAGVGNISMVAGGLLGSPSGFTIGQVVTLTLNVPEPGRVAMLASGVVFIALVGYAQRRRA